MSKEAPRLRVVAAWAAIGLAGLGGCAPLPVSHREITANTVADYATTETLKTARGARWPTSTWWSEYGDTQLDALMTDALHAAPGLAVARARIRLAESVLDSSESARGPQVSGTLTVTDEHLSYNDLTPKTVVPRGWNTFGRAGLVANWELDFWGKQRAAVAAATSEAEAVKAEHAQALRMLTAAIATGYVELQDSLAQQHLLLRMTANQQRLLALTRMRHAQGLESETAVRRAETDYASSQGVLSQVEARIALQRHALAALSGAGPDKGRTFAPSTFVETHAAGFPDELPLHLLGRRPDLTAARLLVEAQLSRVGQKRAEFYPDISLTGMVGLQSLGLDLLTKPGSFVGKVGPALSLPIFTSGRLQAELSGSEARYEEAVASYNQALIQSLQEVADAGASLQAVQKQLVFSTSETRAAQQRQVLVQARYQGGLDTALDVLSAENEYLSHLRAHVHLQHQAFAHDIALKRALGGGYHYDPQQ